MSTTIASRRTMDNHAVTIDAAGYVCHAGGTFTRHAALPLAVALEVAEALPMFDRREVPALVAAASRMARAGGAVDFWTLVRRACAESHRAGARPADMPVPTERAPVLAVWTAETLRQRAAGFIVMPDGYVAR